MFRAPPVAIYDLTNLKRRIDGEPITDETLARLLRHIGRRLPVEADLVGLTADALLLPERPPWLEKIVGPRPSKAASNSH